MCESLSGFSRLINLIVYRYLKTVIVMAKFELKFIDVQNEDEYIKTNVSGSIDNVISVSGKCDGNVFEIWLDKSTAIKFAKTLRTEINKITESEVNNG